MPRPIRNDEVDLIVYSKIIYKRRRLVVLIVLAGMLLAGLLSVFSPPKFEAVSTFFPLSMKENYGTQAAPFVVNNQLNIEDLIISILESRLMADKIIAQLDLKAVWKTADLDRLRAALSDASKISVNKNGLIKLSVRTGVPRLSAQIADAYVNNLEDFNRELSLNAQRQIVQVIDRADVPHKRMPRGIVRKVLAAGFAAFIFSIFFSFFVEFNQKVDIIKKIRAQE